MRAISGRLIGVNMAILLENELAILRRGGLSVREQPSQCYSALE